MPSGNLESLERFNCLSGCNVMKFGTEDGSLGFPTIATSMVVTRPLPLFSYATTVGIHTSLLLFTALFIPRTSSAIFSDTSDFPFLQSASPLDRPQPKSLGPSPRVRL